MIVSSGPVTVRHEPADPSAARARQAKMGAITHGDLSTGTEPWSEPKTDSKEF